MRTSDFTAFLSNARLTDEHINMMLHHIMGHVQHDPMLPSTIQVVDLSFLREVDKAQSSMYFDLPSCPLLQ